MTSLENLYFMPTLTDSCSSQPSTPLQNTFYYDLSDDPFSPLSDMVRPESTTTSSTLTSSSFSGSDLDTPTLKRVNVVCHKKIMKRKSRAVKKNTTTFINAHVSNFRHLVQQMTGVKFGVAPVLKPEPQRVADGFDVCLPTLDTSAFLVDHQQEFTQQGYFPAFVVAEGGAEFNTENFPTLESSL